jgi:fatty-acid desaturase
MFKFSKKLNIRFISIFIMVSMVIPALFINYYTGSIGKYIGSSLYMIVAIWGIFEIIKAFGFNKYNSLITSSTIILFFLIG